MKEKIAMKECDFSELVELFMKLDKKTLAELLALRELYDFNRIDFPKPQHIPFELPPQKPVCPYYLTDASTVSGRLSAEFYS